MRPIPVSVDSQVSTKSSKHQRSTKQLSITLYPNNRPQRHPTPHPPLRSLEQSRKPTLNPFYEPHVDLPLIESVPLDKHSKSHKSPISFPRPGDRFPDSAGNRAIEVYCGSQSIDMDFVGRCWWAPHDPGDAMKGDLPHHGGLVGLGHGARAKDGRVLAAVGTISGLVASLDATHECLGNPALRAPPPVATPSPPHLPPPRPKLARHAKTCIFHETGRAVAKRKVPVPC